MYGVTEDTRMGSPAAPSRRPGHGLKEPVVGVGGSSAVSSSSSSAAAAGRGPGAQVAVGLLELAVEILLERGHPGLLAAGPVLTIPAVAVVVAVAISSAAVPIAVPSAVVAASVAVAVAIVAVAAV